jgi:hypothetical protein
LDVIRIGAVTSVTQQTGAFAVTSVIVVNTLDQILLICRS